MFTKVYHQVLLVVLVILSIVKALGPPSPLLRLDPSRFLEDFRRNLPPLPSRYRTAPVPVLEHFGADVRYTDTPVEIQAGFYIRPRLNARPLLAPLPNAFPDYFNNLRQLEKRIFTPSKGGETPETPGQVKNYEDDLKELEKEQAEELTTRVLLEDVPATSIPPASSFVNVGVTRGNNQEYKYNYAV
ncbi:uncharacterized protein LOC123676007 isoform X2 [Harmonia axyridis]|uniref:uncharacterized protein LOC123676007 isoform X2 n=1 Tax=Harmonia axyridis TaxID=115357 RepID=UPI001E2771A6|nr:uncharacterized protein LOC123676007 isoform X2 [Harmonia axyridis]